MPPLTPIVVHRVPFGKTGLFKVIVEYSDLDKETYPYPLPNTFITKELNLEDSSSFNIRINPILTEVFINKAFKSPYLNVARFITIQNSTIIMFFDEAFGDFHKIKRANQKITKYWITSIIKGIVHLHLRRILHGDIKAANILIFDGLAKLNDFGLSSLIIGKGAQRFKHKLYTPTHRPPEMWKQDQCDLSADIWALGCTIYEMVYGEPLFKVMKTNDDYQRQMKEWCDHFSMIKSGTLSSQSSIKFHSEWNNTNNIELNKLIITMLNPDASKRPTIFDIVKDRYFSSNNDRTSFSSVFSEDVESNSGYSSVYGTSPVESSIINSVYDSERSSNSSPCVYGSLNHCSIVSQRLYNRRSFENDSQLLKIYQLLKLKEEDREIRMLVVCMCESFPKDMRDNHELVNVLHIISHLLTHRGVPYLLTITKKVIFDMLSFSNYINFQYINWDRFYGVENHFIY